jgi:hypothetical protein
MARDRYRRGPNVDGDTHPPDIGAAVGELAAGPVGPAPLLGDGQHGVDLHRCQRVQGDPTGSAVLERADGAQPGAPATHTIIGNAEQTASPGVRSAASDGRSPPPPIWTSTSATPRPLAARHQREHQRPPAPVLPHRHRRVRARRPATSATSPPNSTTGPRKPLRWRTAAEAQDQFLSEPFTPPRVALTG